MKQIPNLFTLLNLFFGCIAIVFALQSGINIVYTTEGEQFIKLTENICYASLFIGLAAVIDFLDGFVARLLKATSTIGKELDSLADVVSFGVAPGVILYQLLRMAFIRENEGLEASSAWLLPAFIFTCAGAYRLARFNVSESKSNSFIGVPIPAAGLMVASLPLIQFYTTSDFVYDLLSNKNLLYAIIFLLSYLMVSKFKMIALKFKDVSIKNNLPVIILLVIAVISAVFLHWIAVPIVFVAYIILSLINKNKLT